MAQATHAVFNQFSERTDYDLLATDAALQESLHRTGAQGALPALPALAREPEAASALLQDFADAAAGEPRILDALRPLEDLLALPPEQLEPVGRQLVQRLVLVAQACLLRRHAPQAVADALIATRLEDGGAGRVVGAIDTRAMDAGAILERAFPA